ncbi:FG-GAP-like repeat-containing protein [Streptomyces sp. UNOB3_S3]|uniref:FG-GAP-like repeat-containing protein n=1 Tax=Streptomyces sp. UNOB3_S3 TaxID=2871682 RepID=UPI001E3066D3|nr:FG-GAP-like repeat-containing protein [Streptomyces sp. UNOB3_S3]MCC3774100.1 VCBS repeat-containing protein [Streptomyces sp. UNOB3_S3]
MSAKTARTAWTVRILATGIAASALATAAPAHAVVGEQAQPGSYAFTTQLTIGDSERGCTGALVEQQWVLTASSCFADNPGQGFKIAAGAPKLKTTAAVGGNVVDVVQLVPREDRDLVLAKLAKPVTGVVPATIATSAPAQGEELRVTGFGRTKDEWVPDRLHHSAFTVGAVKDTSISLSGKSADATICQGDTGGPAFRETNGRFEIIGVNSLSWQGGCFGNESETRKGAVDTRADDVSGWIANRILLGQNLVSAGDYDGDGVADLFSVNSNRELSVSLGKKGGTFNSPRFLTGSWNFSEMTSADLNGDGIADLLARDAKNDLYLWLGNKNGIFSPRKVLTTGWVFTQTAAGDFTGDGKADLVAIDASNTLYLWAGNGDGTFNRPKKLSDGWNFTQTVAGDFTGDGVADLMARDAKANFFLWTSEKNGNFTRAKQLTDGWNFSQTTAADFTGDGKPDLIAKDPTGTASMWFWVGNGDGTFNRPTKIVEGS